LPDKDILGGINVRKVLLVGLDGTSWKLLRPWVERGKLPTIARLLEQGAHGTLLSTIPCRTSPALPAFYTGKNPGTLGVFDFAFSDGSLVLAQNIEYKAIWDVVGEFGYKSCVVNLSTIYPPQAINGVMVSGVCPYKDSEYMYPKAVRAKTQGFHVGKNKLKAIWTGLRDGDPSAVEELKALLQRRYRIFKELAIDGDFGFLLFWISQTDVIQHFCWSKPTLLLGFFQEVDSILADIQLSFPDHVLLIMSDHGFDGFYSKAFHVNAWLMRQGYLKMKGGRLGNRVWPLAYSLAGKLTSSKRLLLLGKRLIGRREQTAARLGTQSRLAHNFYRNLPGVDWERSIAFLDQAWGIRILTENVAPGMYNHIVTEITEKLRVLQDGRGERVTKGVWRRDELYSGKYLNEIPDIVFLSSNGYVPKCAVIGKVFPHALLSPTMASHDFARDGLLAAYGRGIAKGQHVTSAEILDVAPTVLHIMGIDVPIGMDGKVLRELFEEGSEMDRDVNYQDLELKRDITSTALSGEEERVLKERLRGLGYVD
jgi:predicted AlkP superfamily phosphohydrolase/phosphomutase